MRFGHSQNSLGAGDFDEAEIVYFPLYTTAMKIVTIKNAQNKLWLVRHGISAAPVSEDAGCWIIKPFRDGVPLLSRIQYPASGLPPNEVMISAGEY